MKTLLITILTGFVFCNIYAQTYKITEGKEPVTKLDINNCFGEHENSLYVSDEVGKKSETKFTIKKINKSTLKTEWEKLITVSEFKSNLVVFVFEPVITNENILLFFKYYNKEKQERQLYVKRVSFDGHVDKNWTLIGGIDSDMFGALGREFYTPLSPDKKKMLIVSEFKWPKKAQKVTVQLFDIENISKIGNSITLPGGYNAGGIRSEDYRIDNEGNFTYLFYYLDREDDSNVSLAVAIVSKNLTELDVVELPVEQGKELSNYFVKPTKDGKLMYCGFFKDSESPDPKKERKAGLYKYLIDMNGSIASMDFKYFPDDVIRKLNYSDGLIEASTAKKFFSLKHVTEMDGAYYLIGNHNYTIYGNQTTHVNREFLITKIGGNGQIEWIKVFPKHTWDKLNNYNMLVNNNKIHFFYLEHPANLKNSSIDEYLGGKYSKIKDYNGSVMVALQLSADGSAKREVISSKQDWFYNPSRKNIVLESGDAVYIPKVLGKKNRIDVLNVN